MKLVLLYCIAILQNVSSFRTNDNLVYYIIDSDLQNMSRSFIKPAAVNIKNDNKHNVDKKERSFLKKFIPYFSAKSY
jgi:hypothetical protein|tara:strand:+ start:146 stop:376 length:231 start_codon:yes stop_codon:yes gene_type:complete